MERISFQIMETSEPAELRMGETRGDHSFGVNERYLTKDGKPWLPVMAEFHFTRYDWKDWEIELCKIKACGINIISTYLFWIFHEEVQGIFDFKGNRDISHFLEICQKLGLYAFVRIGPWCHGECRNGGFPDWLQHSGLPLRTMDRQYLSLVRKLFEAYSSQIVPWLFENGGPVIGIQLENELTENSAYLEELKNMAVSCGMHAPYYTVTGWGAHVAEFPKGEVLPVFGAYPAAPWTDHCAPLPPSEGYFFIPYRNDSTIGNDQISGEKSEAEEVLNGLPFLTCELGPGVQCTYHRRPIISSMDVASLSMTKLGSGNNLPGYYVFHGGVNPDGGFFQESKLSGYPNDLPVKSYDFQAPLGEYGQIRESYYLLKRQNQFLSCCGEKLAQMPAYFPDRMPSGIEDRDTPRLALRSDGEGGFLFFHTHQRNYPIAPIQDLEISVQYACGQEKIYGPVSIPAGLCGVFPLEQEWFHVKISFMTLQPLWNGKLNGVNTLVCTCIGDILPKIYFRGEWNIECRHADHITVEKGKTDADTCVRVEGLHPARDCVVVISKDDILMQILVLEEADGLRFFPIEIGGENYVVLSDDIVWKSGDAEEREIAVYGNKKNKLWTWPLLAIQEDTAQYSIMDKIRLEKAEDILITQDNPAAHYLFTEASCCPEYRLELSEELVGKEDVPFDALFYFNINADVVQLYADEELIADDFLRGDGWMVSLRRIRPYIRAGKKLRLKCSPIGMNANIYLEKSMEREKVEVSLKEAAVISMEYVKGF